MSATPEELEKVRAEVTSCGEKVKALKSASDSDPDSVAAAIKALLDAKKNFADKNNGIGVDGKPYEAPMTKAEKKKKSKETKQASANQVANPNSANALKKAAKKAEAKAKKAAAKAAGNGSAVATAAASNTPNAGAKKVPVQPTARTGRSPVALTKVLPPMSLAFNPNVSLTERPVVALTVAVMANIVLDLNLVSDHLRGSSCALGLADGHQVVGDMAIARYLLRNIDNTNSFLGLGSDQVDQALIDQWVDYALMMSKLESESKIQALRATLDPILMHSTYLVGTKMTLADVALFATLGFPSQAEDRAVVLKALGKSSPTARWVVMMASAPPVREATQLAVGVAGNAEAVFSTQESMESLVSGMNPLEGATVGSVVTRFPPEPSGYLHIGHAKALLLNDYYARRYNGTLIVRFDDTNPTKEKEEYQQSIIEDLAKLGVKPDVVSFTSDYFGVIRGYAEYMIANGLAYMDDTPQEQMQQERMDRAESKHRNQGAEDSKKYFDLMCSGKEEGSQWCLRAKMDMQSDNGTMRDPVIFRQNTTPHHRSGTAFKAYPTYDLACPIVDSLENVSHALRTTEYNDRDEQYQWIQRALGLRRVRIHAFSRVNFQNTVLSKRKLTWFVDQGKVMGWDDPRFPTVRGVVRRGINIAALRNFMYAQGASRRIVNMEWAKFWAENKKEIDKAAKRFMAIDKENHAKLTVLNGPNASDNAFVTTDYLPKDPSFGKRVLRICKEVLLEAIDTEGIEVGENIVLMRWGVVTITKVDGGLEGEFDPNGDVKAAKRKVSWIANVAENTPCILTEFDNLISKDKLDEGDEIEDCINPNTMASSMAIGDVGLRLLQEHEIIQLERRGYYRVDRPYVGEGKPLVLFMVPDGKSKAMSGLAGKLAHR